MGTRSNYKVLRHWDKVETRSNYEVLRHWDKVRMRMVMFDNYKNGFCRRNKNRALKQNKG